MFVSSSPWRPTVTVRPTREEDSRHKSSYLVFVNDHLLHPQDPPAGAAHQKLEEDLFHVLHATSQTLSSVNDLPLTAAGATGEDDGQQRHLLLQVKLRFFSLLHRPNIQPLTSRFTFMLQQLWFLPDFVQVEI